MQKLFQTTQLSQSVLVLSLHYVHRLEERNSGTIAHPGSESRVAVAALMMANKFVDE
jgi:Cyclin, N-terminal domain